MNGECVKVKPKVSSKSQRMYSRLVGRATLSIVTKSESIQGFFSYRMKFAELDTNVVIPAVPVTVTVYFVAEEPERDKSLGYLKVKV